MAINRGVLGSQTGSMGGITASNWKGKNVYKQKVPANNSSNSPAQQAQRLRFGLLARLAGLAGAAIRVGFKREAVSVTEQNVFTSKNLGLVSFDGEAATLSLDGLQFSSGTVAIVPIDGVNINSAGTTVTVNWNPSANGVEGRSTDKIYIVVVGPGGSFVGMSLGTAMRQAAVVAVPLAPSALQPGEEYGVYVFARRADSTEASATTQQLEMVAVG